MAPLLTFVALLISTTSLITASVDFDTPRLPNGGALFSLSSRQIMPRQGLADCGGDPDCTPQAWGCQCGFGDDSWLDGASDPGGPGSGHPAISSAAPPAPTWTFIPAPARKS